jgi:hypothetical protein
MLDQIARDAARLIENEFAKGHEGGVTQRCAAVQVIVADAIRRALSEASNGMIQYPQIPW